MSKGHRTDRKEFSMAKVGKNLKQQNKVVLDYDPMYKINIHDSMLI